MRRTALTIIATVIGLVLLLQFKTHSSGGATGGLASLGSVPVSSAGRHHTRATQHPRTPHPPTPTPDSHPQSTTTGPSTRAKAVARPVTTTHRSRPRTVTATGQTVNTQYGPVQVRVVETSGRLTNVTAIQVPSSSSHSAEIAAHAVPILRSEALKANSARIDVVSGATYTSNGYAQSLQSALDNA
jgi:uncharacterized protein with FMN-binding domain